MIYAIQAGHDGPVKFGVANNPAKRLSNLQTGNPADLRLLAQVAVHHEKEALIHLHLKASRIRGEWFKPDEQVMRVIDIMREQECRPEEHVLTNFIVYTDPLATEEWTRLCDEQFAMCGCDRDKYRASPPLRARLPSAAQSVA